jgi:hypothetical protein
MIEKELRHHVTARVVSPSLERRQKRCSHFPIGTYSHFKQFFASRDEDSVRLLEGPMSYIRVEFRDFHGRLIESFGEVEHKTHVDYQNLAKMSLLARQTETDSVRHSCSVLDGDGELAKYSLERSFWQNCRR